MFNIRVSIVSIFQVLKFKVQLVLCIWLVTSYALAEKSEIYEPKGVFIQNSQNLRLDSDLNLDTDSYTNGPSYLLGESIEGQLDDRITVKRNAHFRRLGMSLRADTLDYDLVESLLNATGNVTLFREGELYMGPRLFLNPAKMQGYFEDVTYDFTRINGRGKAERINFVKPKEIVLKNATFTTCSLQNKAWELRADTILVDDIRAIAKTENTSLYWDNAELLPLGDLSFAISNKRKTGFLAPTFSVNSKLGLDLTMPYYLNIAPNRDLTIYPRVVGRRGVQLGSDFRFLNKSQVGEVGLQILPSDKISGGDRWLAKLNASHYIDQTKSIGVTFLRVSDDNYFADFGASVLAASQRILPASIFFNGIFQGWSYKAAIREYQVLQDPGAPILPPYEWSPKITFSRDNVLNLGRVTFDSVSSGEATHFTHPSLAEGTRFIIRSKVSTPLFFGSVRLQPTASFHYTAYSETSQGSASITKNRYMVTPGLLGVYANNVGSGGAESYGRVIPSISLEASSILERETVLNKDIFIHTIEPKLFYAFTPYRNQSDFPVFDTSSLTSSLEQLLSESSFFRVV